MKRNNQDVVYEEVLIPAVSLEEYFQIQIQQSEAISLWVDLEGYAYNVLKDAHNLLSNTTCLKIEVEQHEFWQDQKLAEDVVDLMSNHGLIPVLRDFGKDQYNILFCNRELTEHPNFKDCILKNLSQ